MSKFKIGDRAKVLHGDYANEIITVQGQMKEHPELTTVLFSNGRIVHFAEDQLELVESPHESEMITELRKHLNSLSPEEFEKEWKAIEDMGHEGPNALEYVKQIESIHMRKLTKEQVDETILAHVDRGGYFWLPLSEAIWGIISRLQEEINRLSGADILLNDVENLLRNANVKIVKLEKKAELLQLDKELANFLMTR